MSINIININGLPEAYYGNINLIDYYSNCPRNVEKYTNKTNDSLNKIIKYALTKIIKQGYGNLNDFFDRNHNKINISALDWWMFPNDFPSSMYNSKFQISNEGISEVIRGPYFALYICSLFIIYQNMLYNINNNKNYNGYYVGHSSAERSSKIYFSMCSFMQKYITIKNSDPIINSFFEKTVFLIDELYEKRRIHMLHIKNLGKYSEKYKKSVENVQKIIARSFI